MKPGYTTSEFWLTLLTTVLANFGPVADAIGPKTGAWVAAAGTIVYTLARTYAKAPRA